MLNIYNTILTPTRTKIHQTIEQFWAINCLNEVEEEEVYTMCCVDKKLLPNCWTGGTHEKEKISKKHDNKEV